MCRGSPEGPSFPRTKRERAAERRFHHHIDVLGDDVHHSKKQRAVQNLLLERGREYRQTIMENQD
jgi:hypothetical protein